MASPRTNCNEFRRRGLRLLTGIQRHGPVGVVKLAELAGRDYTTVSRQVKKLVSLGLVTRQASKADRRVRGLVITAQGRAMAAALDGERERLAAEVLANLRMISSPGAPKGNTAAVPLPRLIR